MPTERNASLLRFAPLVGRTVVADFDGGTITWDAGALLPAGTDRGIGLVGRSAACFQDRRRPELVEHRIATSVMQRVFGLALGYGHLNDHELRHDPTMAIMAGKLVATRSDCAPVGGTSTLNRLERSRETATRYHKIAHNPAAIEALFVDLFLETYCKPPKATTPDLDAMDDSPHGDQEGRSIRGYDGGYCYLPLYILHGRHRLAAKLRRADIGASAGAVEEIARLVAAIRARWPHVRILLRAETSFTRKALMVWCEENRVDDVFGLARNTRLVEAVAFELIQAGDKADRTGKAARLFRDIRYVPLDSRSRRRRVVGKAEWTGGAPNPRFVVTSLAKSRAGACELYETIDCARGEMDNRSKASEERSLRRPNFSATMRARA